MLRVALFQLPVPNNPATNVALALGYLKAYAHAQGLLDHAAIEILPRSIVDHAGDAAIVAAILARQPDVVGASLYTWNSERTLAILARVRAALPGVRVIVGGPEVQRDNLWVLEHPAVDVAVIGEGEQTFADLLRAWTTDRSIRDSTRIPANREGEHDVGGASSTAHGLWSIAGVAFRDVVGQLIVTDDRVALSDLREIPSPYLLGYLDLPPDGMLMVEVSRWCPYACSFCLYGRNMGAKLGNRYFDLERVLAEIDWGRAQGVERVHFIEANLNLVPLFWPLMRALHERNADRRMSFYAELRGEHLNDAVVEALDRANVRYVEVGLQTANPDALRASHRRTDLVKWAAGTRRLYDRRIEVYLDVILGLPADDAAGVAHTIEFIAGEQLGPYDVFTLQVLPATAVRADAATYGLRFQDRPPYYVLETDRLCFNDLRRLRRDLKRAADLDPDAIDGMPAPRRAALDEPISSDDGLIERLWLADGAIPAAESVVDRLASHVDVVVRGDQLDDITPLLDRCIAANPTTVIDLYLVCDDEPIDPARLAAWREALPWQPGYLDRVAIYAADRPDGAPRRVSPRCFVVLPWSAMIEPEAYRDVAEVIWQFAPLPDEPLPLGAWRAAGGAGIRLVAPHDAAIEAQVRAWEQQTGRSVWWTAAAPQPDVSVYVGRI